MWPSSRSASNLVPGDTNDELGRLRSRSPSHTTERVSVAAAGSQSNGSSEYPSISADGRYVAFRVLCLQPGVGGHERGRGTSSFTIARAGTTERVSVASDGSQANGYMPILRSAPTAATWPSFRTPPTWYRGTRMGAADIFVRDRQAGDHRTSKRGLGRPPVDAEYIFGQCRRPVRGLSVEASNLVPGTRTGRS